MNIIFSAAALFYYILIPLVLTIFIELGVWKLISLLFKKYKSNNFKYMWLSIIAINIATNPALNVLLSLIDPTRQLFVLELGFELAVVFVEAGILYIIYRKEFGKLLLLSAAMNIVSYGMGLILFTPVWL
jgi:hypothetical protein